MKKSVTKSFTKNVFPTKEIKDCGTAQTAQTHYIGGGPT